MAMSSNVSPDISPMILPEQSLKPQSPENMSKPFESAGLSPGEIQEKFDVLKLSK